MTPEEIEIRENFGIKDEDILQIPALALWELCRQFNALIDNKPFPSYLGDFFYRFYCIRIEELAKRKAEERGTLDANGLTKTRKVTNYEDTIKGTTIAEDIGH
jgi:hypothetical protein